MVNLESCSNISHTKCGSQNLLVHQYEDFIDWKKNGLLSFGLVNVSFWSLADYRYISSTDVFSFSDDLVLYTLVL